MPLLSESTSILFLVILGAVLLACSAGLFLKSNKRSTPPKKFFAVPPPDTGSSETRKNPENRQENAFGSSSPESAAPPVHDIQMDKTMINSGEADLLEDFHDAKTMIDDISPSSDAGFCDLNESTAVMENRNLDTFACLIVMNGNFSGKVFKVNPDGTSIGSGENCAVILNHKGVPALKAQLCFEAGTWRIADVSRETGSQLLADGKPVSKTDLADRMIIRIGKVDMMFRNIC